MGTSTIVVPRTYRSYPWKTGNSPRSYPQPDGLWLATGHYTPAKFPFQNMAGQVDTQIYPRPDSETAAYARHHWILYNANLPNFPNLITLGIRGGAAPLNFVIAQAPAGTTLDAASWQAGWTNADALIAGYGRLRIIPQADYSNELFIIYAFGQDGAFNIIQFTASTLSGYYFNATTPADSYGFICIDPVNGVDGSAYPSATGLIDTSTTPIKTLNWAFGTTGQQTYPNAYLVTRAGTLPTFAQDATNGITVSPGVSPIGAIQYPGETTAVDMTLSGTSSGLYCNGAELFFQGFTVTNGNLTGPNFKHIRLIGATHHLVVDNVQFPDAISQPSSTDNGGPLEFSAQSIGLHTYPFINGVGQTNTTSPGPNQFALNDLYTTQYTLMQFSSVSGTPMSCFNVKDSVSDATLQFCDIVYASGGAYAYQGGYQYAVNPLNNDRIEYRYCNLLGAGVGTAPRTSALWLNGTGYAYTADLYVYRCTLNGPIAYYQNSGNSNLLIQDCAIQYGAATEPFQINTGSGYIDTAIASLPADITYGTTDTSGNGQECLGQSGILNPDGTLVSSLSAYVGRRGAQIA